MKARRVLPSFVLVVDLLLIRVRLGKNILLTPSLCCLLPCLLTFMKILRKKAIKSFYGHLEVEFSCSDVASKMNNGTQPYPHLKEIRKVLGIISWAKKQQQNFVDMAIHF